MKDTGYGKGALECVMSDMFPPQSFFFVSFEETQQPLSTRLTLPAPS